MRRSIALLLAALLLIGLLSGCGSGAQEPATDAGAHPGTDAGAHPGAYPGTDPGAHTGAHPGAHPGTHPGAHRGGAELLGGGAPVLRRAGL